MQFGIFDHLDRNSLPLGEFYEQRLKLTEAFERAGFYSYHLAEHHFTPLGMAPSPSVFLASIAQRTKRLRFGPLVYALPLHHPLRVLEEIIMLDHLSSGRLDIGFGRGSVPYEIAYYAQDVQQREKIYRERLEIILKAFSVEVLDFDGEFDSFKDVPMEMKPLQKPHPPIYYGAHSPDSAERAARKGLNIINNDITDVTRACIARYREVWRELHGTESSQKMGMARFVFVADTDREALSIANRAYPVWYRSFNYLHRMHGSAPQLGERPPTFDALIEYGTGIAGSPATVAKVLSQQIAESGTNYLVCQMAFGDLTFDEMLRSVKLFAESVMPVCVAAAKTPVKMTG
ncbi:MAG TPA: LLM class flavin-dependent oxidoreductase [Xanthobacteraceae bacterium]|jgi:alkanesulfonate monooxygenase SsuD/methylene tetrahydromethanopterin reductase-like flavin-dependent oxidoreductase (luciferase family)|nr:LLM class flavin-dependent oxidoreductase [Xanthobacteraceae bacterium]